MRLVGHKCLTFDEKDPSVMSCEVLGNMAKKTIKLLEKGGDMELFQRANMATELFEVFLHSADAESHEPCVTILTLAKDTMLQSLIHTGVFLGV